MQRSTSTHRVAVRALATLAPRAAATLTRPAAAAAAPSRLSLSAPLPLSSARRSARCFSSSASAGPALVLAEHNNATLGDATLSAVSAAAKLAPSELVLLVLGSGEGGAAVAAQAAKVAGVQRVILVDDVAFAHAMAEQSATIAAIARDIKATHVIGCTSASGKNILPRLGAHLDVQPITEVVTRTRHKRAKMSGWRFERVECCVAWTLLQPAADAALCPPVLSLCCPSVCQIEIQSADTFVRPVYAGNAISTVQSSDAIKVLTVRPTSFEKAATGSGNVSRME